MRRPYSCIATYINTSGTNAHTDTAIPPTLLLHTREALTKPMAENITGFQDYLKKELENTKGIYVPVRAGFLRRLLIRRTACKNLHPNPEDEFCIPTIGPNSGIISKYCQDFRRFGTRSSVEHDVEPLTVDKIRPSGYLILNGHHRWAAAIMTGQRSLPIRIVDLPLEEDIQKMLQRSRSDRRVTLDLDEVVFRSMDDGPVEKLPFFLRVRYRQRLRLGIPALFRFLNDKGYDIWVYSANYYSFKQIQTLFMLYQTRVTGVVTGTGGKGRLGAAVHERLKKSVSEQYPTTIHIDARGIVKVDSRNKTYEEYSLNETGAQWSQEIMNLIGELDKHE